MKVFSRVSCLVFSFSFFMHLVINAGKAVIGEIERAEIHECQESLKDLKNDIKHFYDDSMQSSDEERYLCEIQLTTLIKKINAIHQKFTERGYKKGTKKIEKFLKETREIKNKLDNLSYM